jgi:two-component system C4-dicarboxylate transport sensor histidine kinase DctB
MQDEEDLMLAARREAAAQARTVGPLGALVAVVACLAIAAATYSLVLRAHLRGEEAAAARHLDFSTLNLQSMLARNEALPSLLALDGKLGAALDGPTPARALANKYLEAAATRAQLSATYLMNSQGLTIAASNWAKPVTFVGENYEFRPYFQAALQGQLGRFYGVGATSGEAGYFLATQLRSTTGQVGVLAVKVSLQAFEDALTQSGEWVSVVDSEGVVILSAVPSWRYHVLHPLSRQARASLAAARQYGSYPLAPVSAKAAILPNTHEVRLSVSGKHGKFSIVRRPVGTLGWQMVVLVDQTPSESAALLAAVTAAALAACVLGMLWHLRFKKYQREEVRLVQAALHRANQELEQRIAVRTGALSAANADLATKVQELERTEAILRQTRDDAVQAGKLTVLGQMSAGMTHELNQPLGALHTLSDNTIRLIEQDRIAEAKDNLQIISEVVARMGRIVKQLKVFARKDPTNLESVQLSSAIEHATMLVEPHRRDVGAVIDVVGVTPALRVKADPVRIEQVLVNLLRNAIDAVADCDRREIVALATQSGGSIELAISDSGPGIREDVVPRLFEPFMTTKPAGYGLGLGLALSLSIVREFGGRIEACNGRSGGATFKVILESA